MDDDSSRLSCAQRPLTRHLGPAPVGAGSTQPGGRSWRVGDPVAPIGGGDLEGGIGAGAWPPSRGGAHGGGGVSTAERCCRTGGPAVLHPGDVVALAPHRRVVAAREPAVLVVGRARTRLAAMARRPASRPDMSAALRSPAVMDVAASRSHKLSASKWPTASAILASRRSPRAIAAAMAWPSTGTASSSTASASLVNIRSILLRRAPSIKQKPLRCTGFSRCRWCLAPRRAKNPALDASKPFSATPSTEWGRGGSNSRRTD